MLAAEKKALKWFLKTFFYLILIAISISKKVAFLKTFFNKK